MVDRRKWTCSKKSKVEKAVEEIPIEVKVVRFEKDFFETRVKELNMVGFEYDGYFIDIGIPEDYKKVQTDFKNFNYR